MKKFVYTATIVCSMLLSYTVSDAKETQVNVRIDGTINDHSSTNNGWGMSVDFLQPSSIEGLYLGVEGGFTTMKMDNSLGDDLEFVSLYTGLVGKYYFNDELYIRMASGFITGDDSDSWKGSINVGGRPTSITKLNDTEAKGVYFGLETGFEFNNGVVTFAGWRNIPQEMVERTMTKTEIINKDKNSDRVNQYYCGVGYKF